LSSKLSPAASQGVPPINIRVDNTKNMQGELNLTQKNKEKKNDKNHDEPKKESGDQSFSRDPNHGPKAEPVVSENPAIDNDPVSISQKIIGLFKAIRAEGIAEKIRGKLAYGKNKKSSSSALGDSKGSLMDRKIE
jgi:hypothetical protein